MNYLTRLGAVGAVAVGLLAAGLPFARDAVAARIPSGVVAAHLVGRLIVTADGVCEMVGYYAFIDGVQNLFAGDPGEQTALFSFRSEKFKLQYIVNGALIHVRGQVLTGTYIPVRVYYDAYPNRDFGNPDSFSTGQQVAEFHTRGSMATAVQPGISINIGTLDLATTTPFTHGGSVLNLRDMGDGVTITLQGTAPPSGSPWEGLSWPFGGSAIAVAPFPPPVNQARRR